MRDTRPLAALQVLLSESHIQGCKRLPLKSKREVHILQCLCRKMGELTAINKYSTQPYPMIFAVVHLRSSSMQSALQTADFDWHILKHSTSLPAFVVNHYHVPVVVPTCAAVPLSLAAAKLACLEPPALTSWPAPRGVASARCVGEVAHGHRPRGSVQPRWRI